MHGLQVGDGRIRFDVDSNHLDEAVRLLSGLGVRSLTSQPPTLEDLFLRHYGDEPAANGVELAAADEATGDSP